MLILIYRGKDSNDDVKWDGVEVRLLKLLSDILNFTRDYHEAKDIDILGYVRKYKSGKCVFISCGIFRSGDAVVQTMREGKSNLGIAGLYVTHERVYDLDMSHGHTQDCAVFISLTSTALPK